MAKNAEERIITINMIALTMGREGMCGGSRIFIELAKRWIKRGCSLNIFVTDEGFYTCKKYGIEKARFYVAQGLKFKKLGLFIFYFVLLAKGILLSIRFGLQKEKADLVYSTSDFWPDSLSGFVMSKIAGSARWVAGFYLFAPFPFDKNNPYRGKNFLRGFLYYFTQLPIYFLVKSFADIVCVTSEPDAASFITNRRSYDKVMVIMGGVDNQLHRQVYGVEKIYDACFMGRFHPQKGVIELIDIWRMVVDNKSDAKLLIIGYGRLLESLTEKININSLANNVKIMGFIDGEEKVLLLNQCRVVLHPAFYDSGGMSACEAMACGLPAVGFDLPALKTYYPKGMIKTPCFDLKAFAQNITELLENKELYLKVKSDALAWASEWDWDKRAEKIFNNLTLTWPN